MQSNGMTDVTGIAVELTAKARARALQQSRLLQACLKAVFEAEAELEAARVRYEAAADAYREARSAAKAHFTEAELLAAGAAPLRRSRRGGRARR